MGVGLVEVRRTLAHSLPPSLPPQYNPFLPLPFLSQSLSLQLLRTHQLPKLRGSLHFPPYACLFQFTSNRFIRRRSPSFTAMQSSSSSPLDLMSAIIKGKVDPSNVSSDSANEVASLIFENREIVMILTTSIAVLIGCVIVLLWRRSNGSKPKAVEPLKPVIVKAPELEVDDGTKKVTIFFGTQTGTAEGFAKVRLYMHTYFHFYVYIHVHVCVSL